MDEPGVVWDLLRTSHRGDAAAEGRVPDHRPLAAVLACSDARVPPSLVFGQPEGSLFIVRVAGNTATDSALASLDYAVDQLGVKLVVVLGHSSCGAVTAAREGTCDGYLAPIVEPICKLARANPALDVDGLVEVNVAHVVERFASHDGPLGVALRSGEVQVVGAVHRLTSGALDTIVAPRAGSAGADVDGRTVRR